MLQFRAKTADSISKDECKVDCWVIPRVNSGGCTLRSALYRLIVQGFRRCQGVYFAIGDTTLFGYSPAYRRFFSGEPVWEIDNGKGTTKPWGYYRVTDAATGAMFWVDENNVYVEHVEGGYTFDTKAVYRLNG
jgi:hypothetical protein